MCRAMEDLYEEGIAAGRAEVLTVMIKNMHKAGMSDEDITKISGIPMEEILEIKKEIIK